jgi:hypothetical protein
MNAYEVHCVPIQYCIIEEKEKRNRFWWEHLNAEEWFEDFAVDGNTSVKLILLIIITYFNINNIKMSVDWLHLAKERGQCRALVNMVMDLRI